MTEAARRLLDGASDWVGYGLYLDLAKRWRSRQHLHRFALGEERDRAALALALAGEGRDVALICSGDAGIYAMAALVYEFLDPASGAKIADSARRVAVDVIPGISAFQAAAAAAGAMIGHDFCCISLSDLLTPWELIERRLAAAAEGDFVIALYNPRSRERRDQLERAMAIVSRHRPPATPVVVASNLGRPGETVTVVSMKEFDCGRVDMLTVVMVGSSQSTTITRGDGRTVAYTPRGYAAKRKHDERQ